MKKYQQLTIDHIQLPTGQGFVLRDYQKNGVAMVRSSLASGNKRVVMVLSTGGGKSAILAEIARLAVEKGKKVLFLVHRRNLVEQTRKAFAFHGVANSGVIMAGHETALHEPVQLATIQTYGRRIKLEEGNTVFNFPADLILVDEVHRGVSQGYAEVFSHYPDAAVVGCTATPMRGDGRGLGEVFSDLVEVADTQTLTDQGYLAPCRYFAPSQPDLEKIKIVRGDYDQKELEKRMNQAKLVGDVVENWSRLASGRKTIVFAVSVAHSKALAVEFNRHNIPAYHLSSKSTEEQREYAFREMERGNIQVICNCALYQEGMDVPDISCVVMARPTKSLGLYRQCAGRGLRPSPGKEMILLDHGGCIEENGLLTDPIEWSLDGKKKAWKKKKRDEKPREKRDSICSSCALLFTGSVVCPDCGSEAKSFGKKVDVVDGDLEEINPKKASTADKAKFLAMLKAYIPRQNNPNPKRINGSFRGRFGIWPHHSYKDCSPKEPDQEFYAYMKHQAIKYAKQQEKCNG
jgi:superfamily II DNA or RNA helicase